MQVPPIWKQSLRAQLLIVFSLGLIACQGQVKEACEAPRELCDGVCVSVLDDPQNCGGCGIACAEGVRCLDGSCEGACPLGQELCGEGCVDTESDAAHCGGCDRLCEDGRVCVEGSCECPEGLLLCGDSCVDPYTDIAHCGGCGTHCGLGFGLEGASCELGSCVLHCAERRGDCDGEVANGCERDLLVDDKNCGACGVACGPDEQCVEGACTCKVGERCEGAGGAICVDTSWSTEHCGACASRCEAGANAHSVACVDGECLQGCEQGFFDCNGDPADGCEASLESDAEHCGACGHRCDAYPHVATAICVQGSCAPSICEDPWRSCDPDSPCGTDIETEVAHCGSCGNDCSAREGVEAARCVDGGCHIDACIEGWGNCDGNHENGCEADFRHDLEHCGDCGKPCETFCVSGTCVRPVQIAAAKGSTCARMSDGTVACWGSNQYGQLGDGTTVDRLTPAFVNNLKDVVQLGAGIHHFCARRANDTIVCWGDNTYKQLGTLEDRAYSENVAAVGSAHGAIGLEVGPYHNCAIMPDEKVKCWGRNDDVQIGDGSQDATRPASTVLNLQGVKQLALGARHSCALLGTGELRCWGSNSDGQLGNGQSGQGLQEPLPIAVALASVSEITAGEAHTCAARGALGAHCWGANHAGQLGDGTQSARSSPTPVSSLEHVESIVAGGDFSCAILGGEEAGALVCWGAGGKIGDGASAPSAIPVLVPISGARGLGGGADHACVVDEEERAWCWGAGAEGALGTGGYEDEPAPVPVRWR